MYCKYCDNKVCDGKNKTIAEWNKCPWHKADWETNISIFYWLLDLITLGIAKEFIFSRKLKQHKYECIHNKRYN